MMGEQEWKGGREKREWWEEANGSLYVNLNTSRKNWGLKKPSYHKLKKRLYDNLDGLREPKSDY